MAVAVMKYYYKQHTLKSELGKVITRNYKGSGFNVPTLAKLMRMNERSLYRMCKKHLDVSPNQFIRTFKIDKAKELLLKGKKSEEIAKKIGYNCTSAFLYAFKKELGVSPINFILAETK